VRKERDEKLVHAGLDTGKEYLLCMLRWRPDDFERPWRIRNPVDLARLAELLSAVAPGRQLIVALEPTGTYGDALRPTLLRAGLTVHRVSPKAASDYAEVFDGVPSQHDGKDAGVVAERAAQGRSWPWPWHVPSEDEQERAYQVDGLDGQRRQLVLWCGRVEALRSRHGPEATRWLKATSGVRLRCLATYGGPRGLAGDPDAVTRVRRWGKGFLSNDKALALVASAPQTAGVTRGRWDEERLRRYAQAIQHCQREMRGARRRLRALAQGQETIQALGEVVGVPTACVLWVALGNPAAYHGGPAYRKAMGRNLAERSSGRWEGRWKISKRGSASVRRWLYRAALRWLRHEPVRSWYVRPKAPRRGEGKAAVVGVLRQLALALYRVAGRGEPFDRQQWFRSRTEPSAAR